MKIVIKYSVVLILAISGFGFQQNFDPNAKIKACFIYNFTKYFEWPEKMKTGNFIIHLVGSNNSLNAELNRMASTKQVGNQKLEIKSGITIDNSVKPHIVFLLSEASEMLKEANKSKGTLVITEKSGLAKAGAAINFVVMDNKQKFEYSEKNAEKAGLKTSNELKNLAIAVD